jgi:hypothetical protein
MRRANSGLVANSVSSGTCASPKFNPGTKWTRYLSCCSERDVGLRNRQSSDRAEHKNDVGHAVTGQRAQFTHRLSSIC